MSDSLIDRTIGFRLGGVDETEIAFTTPLGEGLYSYARRENPTVSDCERALAEIEMSKSCILTPCGMAAINIALSIFNDPDDHRPWIFPADVYSGTEQYAIEVLQNQRGVNTKFADPAGQNSTTSNLISAIEDEPPALVFIEPISNPLLDIIDIHAVAKAAHHHGARVVVDNTIATPYLFHPLDAGADSVVHSVTKYLAGHNNILAGAICVNDPDLRALLLTHRNTIGSVLSPDDAGRLKAQLLTFSLRLARQNATAMKIAEYLENHPAIAKVRYPGLSSHSDYKLAQEMFDQRGFGAIITFDLARSEEGSRRFVHDVSPHIPHIGSMGDVTTSFLHIKACFGEGYEPSTIRLSVGIEPAEQIISSLEHALRDAPA
jgi:cystathionine beta-lyase/cystathionine gamma-synthase